MRRGFGFACVLILLYACSRPNLLCAESGAAAWLRYAPMTADAAKNYSSLPAATFLAGDSPTLKNAQRELVRGVRGMLGRDLRVIGRDFEERAIVIGGIDQVRAIDPGVARGVRLRPDGFLLSWTRVRDVECLVVAGANDRGALYGVFALLRKIAQGHEIAGVNEVQQPSAPIRWVNQWDNLDGTIERGYGGPSIFYSNGAVRSDLTRASEYARLLASIGINGCVVNNVNANARILESDVLPELARIAAAFRLWGVRLGLSIDLSAPKTVGGLDTFDPLDPRVARWWRKKVDELYRVIPDFGGVVVKADSEGRLGPSAYGRTHADAANVIARALKPRGGLVFYRAFVYNHHLDWTNLKNDRAKAAYDNFHPLDGKFDGNAIIQIKNGPIDFQVREPVSPLIGGLERTNQAIELQVTQEYMGQQHHTVFLVPMWKEALNFDLRVHGRRTPVKDIVTGRSFRRPVGGYVGVVNVGMADNWLGNHLALANLYGFGRLAWDPELSAKGIIDEWTRLTFGNNPDVVQTISDIQLASWPTYESYTGVLGLQTLTNITGSHYGPAPASQERNGWGQWIRAERDGIGMDRSVATGTRFVAQYAPDVRKLYENTDATPDELLLFFHHVPYTHKLHSGKTIIQNIYDAHYDGADRVSHFLDKWGPLRGHIDDQRFNDVQRQLTYQAGHAIVWRDAINDWFHDISGIADERGRVGNHPGRIEAEAMHLDGYTPLDVTPWEGASGAKAVACAEPATSCSAHFRFAGSAGCHGIDVQYFDQSDGVSTFRLFVGNDLIDEWKATMRLPVTALNADSSTRRRITGVYLRPGDEIRIEGVPEGGERAALDYIELNEIGASSSACAQPPASAVKPRIAITFDDLPAHGSLPPGETRVGVASKVIEALRQSHVPATYGFMNGALLDQQPADASGIQAWLAAGNVLGNHSFSHLNLNQHSLEEFQADITRNEPLLEKFMSDGNWRWLRFPYLAEGDTPDKRVAVRAFLLQRGYKIAGTTMSFADYLYNEPYARCAAKGDTKAIALLEDTFLAAADESITYYRNLSHTLYGRDIPYVLLMHLGAFDAKMLPRLLELYRSRGFEFVTLNEAERDEFYNQDTDLHLPPGPDNLEGIMGQRRLPLPAHALLAPQFDALCR